VSRKAFVVRRSIQLVILYFAIATALFLIFHFSPGDPITNLINQQMTAQQVEQIREQFGLDEPLYVQYGKWLRNVAVLNFGTSYMYGRSVWSVISNRIWNTLVLMLTAIVVAYIVAVPLGAYLAWNRDTSREQMGVIIGLVSRSAPVFWTGLLGIYLFAITFNLVPTGGMKSATSVYPSKLALYTSPEFLHHLILPALVQGFYYFSLPMLLMRSSMLEVMNEEFVGFAKLKGLTERRVMVYHAARNAMLPVVTAFAVGAARVIGGSVVLETVFDWPGIGNTLVQAVVASDYPMAQGAFMLLAILVLVANFIADLSYGYLDPTVTYD
jgi:peptide/nickel transport system permease protein